MPNTQPAASAATVSAATEGDAVVENPADTPVENPADVPATDDSNAEDPATEDPTNEIPVLVSAEGNGWNWTSFGAGAVLGVVVAFGAALWIGSTVDNAASSAGAGAANAVIDRTIENKEEILDGARNLADELSEIAPVTIESPVVITEPVAPVVPEVEVVPDTVAVTPSPDAVLPQAPVVPTPRPSTDNSSN